MPEKLKPPNGNRQAIVVWVSNNRNKITELARSMRPRVSPQFVHMVLYGHRKSRDGKVERKLRAMGAPLK